MSVSAEISHQTNLNMQNYVENMCCSLFLFQTRKTLQQTLKQIWSKKSKLTVKAEIWYQETDLNMRNSMMMLTFSVFGRKYLFFAHLISCDIKLLYTAVVVLKSFQRIKNFFMKVFKLVSFKVKLHFRVKTNIKFFIKLYFHVKTNIQFFTALMPLEYGKLF